MNSYYPMSYSLSPTDYLFGKLPLVGAFYCPICSRLSPLYVLKRAARNPQIEMRENIPCFWCRSSNRNRQLAWVLCHSPTMKRRYCSLNSFARHSGLHVYNTEATRAVHHTLLKMGDRYVYSEYFGPEKHSGEQVNGIMHQDLMKTSFPDNSFDVVMTSDVLEHVPDAWTAFSEIYRILKPGGRHVFTVPFYQDRTHSEIRARVTEQGEIEHLAEPIYHVDPLRPVEGTLVFQIFSLDMLPKLEEHGFKTNMYKVHYPLLGILGQNGLVFESTKIV